jgi:hypothetical protein
MTRLLLASTALAALLATGAFAQDASSSASMESSMMDSSMMSSQMSDASSMESSMMDATSSAVAPAPRTPIDLQTGYSAVDTDRLATKIIGSPVYDGTGTDANNLGDINDLILDQNGNVAAVVIGVGGFLGLGEKQVAVDYTSLQWTVAADNTERFVLATTKDALTSAPDFKTVDDQPNDAASGTDATTSGTDTTASSSSAM